MFPRRQREVFLCRWLHLGISKLGSLCTAIFCLQGHVTCIHNLVIMSKLGSLCTAIFSFQGHVIYVRNVLIENICDMLLSDYFV